MGAAAWLLFALGAASAALGVIFIAQAEAPVHPSCGGCRWGEGYAFPFGIGALVAALAFVAAGAVVRFTQGRLPR
ncbi:MAG: hypothetical protein ACYDBQ_04355 [Thermoplasmatota archaeon]